MLSLDADDYEALGWGSERLLAYYAVGIATREGYQRERARRYGQTDAGREKKRIINARRKGRGYFKAYYAANAEKIRKQVRALQVAQKARDPEAFRAKDRERQRRYRERKREQVRREQGAIAGSRGVCGVGGDGGGQEAPL